MAPDAPTLGMAELALTAYCERVAARPASK